MRKVIKTNGYKGLASVNLVRHDDDVPNRKGKYHVELLYNDKGVPKIDYFYPSDQEAYAVFEYVLTKEMFKKL